jgi:hypothetical protein
LIPKPWFFLLVLQRTVFIKMVPHFKARFAEVFTRNAPYVRRGDHTYNTPLPPDSERCFRLWLGQNDVCFDPEATVVDYDMRGFWMALMAGDPKARFEIDQHDGRAHYPDYWKTPYHQTFSNESQWATSDAPHWNEYGQLVETPGTIPFDSGQETSSVK